MVMKNHMITMLVELYLIDFIEYNFRYKLDTYLKLIMLIFMIYLMNNFI